MNKAFIFDMDGVVIDSEHAWQQSEKPMLVRVLGKEIAERIGNTVGLNAHHIFKKAQELGSSISLEDIAEGYGELAPTVYASSQITPGVEQLVEALDLRGYKIGLVTQSPKRDMELVLARLSYAKMFERTVSLFNHAELQPKPSPDGYRYVLKEFDAEPNQSFVLEDSNAGIQSAKSADTFVIAFTGNLLQGYKQAGADAYVETMSEVVAVIDDLTK